jgi:hypothetical protein
MRVTTGRLAAPALFLGAAMLVLAGGADGQPGKDKEPDKDKKGAKGGPDKGAKELHKAFDDINDLATSVPAGQEATRLFDQAKAFYRAAVKAFPADPRRARELALAADETVCGLNHLRRATAQPVANLPEPPLDADPAPAPKDGPKGKDDPKGKDGPKGKEGMKDKDGPKGKEGMKDKDGPKGKEEMKAKDAPPPPKDGAKGPDRRAERGPWSPALDALTDVGSQLTAAAEVKGAGREFVDAARTAYRKARAAYEGGEYRKAEALARAADAWLRVGDHLTRAEWDGSAAPPPPAAPEPKKKGAPPLPPAK